MSVSYTHLVNSDAVKDAVRSCKVNIFKNTSRLFFRVMHHEIGLDAILIDRHDLARKHVADKGSSDRVKRTCLGGQDIGIITLSDTERLESLRIAGTDEFSRAADHKGVRTLDLLHSVCHGSLSGSHQMCIRDRVSGVGAFDTMTLIFG